MLYLMMQKTDSECLVKVGYSKGGTSQRRRTYRSHNPRAIMRSSCAGSTAMEASCRSDLIQWGGVRITGTEWFTVSPELFQTLYQEGMRAFRPKHNPIHFLEEFSTNPLTKE